MKKQAIIGFTALVVMAAALAFGWRIDTVSALGEDCDGRMIVYHGANGTRTELKLIDTNGFSEVTLRGYPDSTDDRFNDVSEDGEFILFTSYRNIEPDFRSDIFRVRPDGTGLTNLTNGSEGRFENGEFSPDGTKIVYLTDIVNNVFTRPAVFIMNADGTNRVRLSGIDPDESRTNSDPSFSPDGSRVVFACDCRTSLAHPDTIFTVNTDGTNLGQLTPNTSVNSPFNHRSQPRFSADGTLVYYLSNEMVAGFADRDIVAVASIGSPPAHLTDEGDVSSFEFSPDGSKIAYSGEGVGGDPDSDIVIMNANGSNKINITNRVGIDRAPNSVPIIPGSHSHQIP